MGPKVEREGKRLREERTQESHPNREIQSAFANEEEAQRHQEIEDDSRVQLELQINNYKK